MRVCVRACIRTCAYEFVRVIVACMCLCLDDVYEDKFRTVSVIIDVFFVTKMRYFDVN